METRIITKISARDGKKQTKFGSSAFDDKKLTEQKKKTADGIRFLLFARRKMIPKWNEIDVKSEWKWNECEIIFHSAEILSENVFYCRRQRQSASIFNWIVHKSHVSQFKKWSKNDDVILVNIVCSCYNNFSEKNSKIKIPNKQKKKG